MVRPPQDGHDWFSIEDPGDDATWLFDTTFLLSDYHCIYGSGCRSIDHEPDPTGTLGCCTHGAHFVDDEDRATVTSMIGRLTDAEWQFRPKAVKKADGGAAAAGAIKQNKSDEWVTRKVDGACIFLNRDGFEGGAGCALHIGAVNRGERPVDWKPDVCWQVPIRLDVHENDYGYETIFVRAWERRDWGPGGDEFNWWCTEDDAAYTGPAPVYITAKDELVEMVGRSIYDRLAAELDRRRAETPVSLA